LPEAPSTSEKVEPPANPVRFNVDTPEALMAAGGAFEDSSHQLDVQKNTPKCSTPFWFSAIE